MSPWHLSPYPKITREIGPDLNGNVLAVLVRRQEPRRGALLFQDRVALGRVLDGETLGEPSAQRVQEFLYDLRLLAHHRVGVLDAAQTVELEHEVRRHLIGLRH